MITIDPPLFYGYTLFCDDIRNEANGKVTFVGAYTAHMVVHSGFPVVLPKFGMWIQYNQRADSVIRPLRFVIYLPGDSEDKPSIINEIPEEGADEAIAKAGDIQKIFGLSETTDPRYVSVGASAVFSPFIIAQPGVIKVRAVRNDQLARLGGLAVIDGKQSDAAA